jgi:hypothetical protein
MKVFGQVSAMALTLAGLSLMASHSTAEASQPSALATVEGDGYSIVVTDGSGKVGQETQVTVTIRAKEGYKVNDKYPFKLKLADAPSGIELPKPVLKKGDGSFDGKNAFTFKVPVKATRAGSFDVKGNLKFSVCNDQSCLIEKKDVKAKVTAK